MKKIIITFFGLSLFFICLFFSIKNSYAEIHFIAKQGSVTAEKSEKPCQLLGYKYTTSNCPSGKLLSVQCPSDPKYYMNCGCDIKNKFTASTCKAPNTMQNGCEDTYFDTCGCGTEYKFDSSNCKSPKVLVAADACTIKTYSGSVIVNGATKYKTCNCPTTYSKTCTGDMIPTDTSDSCDGKYTACKCNPTTYPLTNCPNGAAQGTGTCTEENGAKRYQSCKASCSADYRWNLSNCNGVPFGEECDGKYKSCEWIVNPGDIVYSDGTVSPNVLSGKTAVGIIFSKDPDQMMALDNFTHWWTDASLITSVTCKKPNASTTARLSPTSRGAVFNDMNGYLNTYCIKEDAERRASSVSYPVFNYIWDFSAGEKPKGHWYTPTMGQYFIMRDNVSKINAARNKLGLENMTTTLGSSNDSGDQYYYWVEHFSDHYSIYSKKNPNFDPSKAGKNVNNGYAPTIYPAADLCKRDSTIINGVCVNAPRVGCPSGYTKTACTEYQGERFSDNGSGYCYSCSSWSSVCGKCATVKSNQTKDCNTAYNQGRIAYAYPQERDETNLSDYEHLQRCLAYAETLRTSCLSSNSSRGCPTSYNTQ